MGIKSPGPVPASVSDCMRAMYDAVRRMRRTKWIVGSKSYQIQALTEEHDRIIVKLARMNAAIDTDMRRGMYEQLFESLDILNGKIPPRKWTAKDYEKWDAFVDGE